MTRKFVIADQNAVSAEGHFKTYTKALADAAQASGCEVVILWNKRFPIATLSGSCAMQAVFSCTEAEAAARGLIACGEGHFGFELETALRSLDLGAGDHVVVHTCHFVELVEALDYLATLPPARNLPDFHIVVRYDPDVYCYRMRHLLDRLNAILRTPYLCDKLHLHSDTQQLARAFTALFGTPVGVCPIPVDLDQLRSATTHAPKPASPRPLIATYLGTARSEKGYRDLRDALVYLKKEYLDTDRLHFVLQCSAQSIASEPGLADYQREFEAYLVANDLQTKVRLIGHVVEQEEYCALVAASDIVLLAYSPTSYRYRSSSVLIEAMVSGKVIVTRAGSWMASRVSADHAICYAEQRDGLGPALAGAVQRYDELQAGATARQAEAIRAAAPETLARYFLACGNSPADTDSRPTLAMIGISEEIATASPGGSVFLSRLASCIAAGYRVRVLLLNMCVADDFDARRRIADALRPFPIDSLAFLDPANIVTSMPEAREKPAAVYLAAGLDPDIIAPLGWTDTPLLSEATLRQVYPFPPRPARVEHLAGPVDGSELIASCDPLDGSFRMDDRPVTKANDPNPGLRQLASVDILLVAPEPEFVRWFHETVYAPFLAKRGVNVLVVGDVGSPPDIDAFLCVGAVGNRDPLFAAAKIIVTTNSDGASIALLEALARGKPTVLFGQAPAELAREGFRGHEDPSALADEIIALLDSVPRRRSAAQKSVDLARRLGAGGAEAAIIARLSECGVATPRASLCEMSPTIPPIDDVEWGPAIVAANRFVRDRLANEPFENINRLADPSGEGRAFVTRIAQALIDERRAPLLRVDSGLLARVLRQRTAGGAAEIIELAEIGADIAYDDGTCSSLVVSRRFPTEVVIADSARIDETPLMLASTSFEHRENRVEGTVWRMRDGDGAESFPIRLPRDGASRKLTLRQDVPLREDARVYGRSIFVNWSFDDETLTLRGSPPAHNDFWQRPREILLRTQWFLRSWAPWAKANQLFDAEWYARAYPEAKRAGIALFRHYERYGVGKGYQPNPFFDPAWYAHRYGVSVAGAFRHYLEFGHDPRFDPGPLFSAERYLDENPDIARDWRWSPLLHYTLMGRREGREIYPAEPVRPYQSLALPVVIARSGFAWVEFVLDASDALTPPFTLDAPAGELALTLREEDGRMIARATLPRDAMAAGLVYLRATRRQNAPPVAIRVLRTGWTSGD